MSFFADIIHDSRRSIRSSESRSDSLAGLESQPHSIDAQKLYDRAPSATVASDTMANQPDENNTDQPLKTVQVSITSTKNSALLDTQPIIESDHKDTDINDTAISPNINISSDYRLIKQQGVGSETAIDAIDTHLTVNSEPVKDEKLTAKLHSTESLPKSVEAVKANSEPVSKTAAAAATEIVQDGHESRVVNHQMNATVGTHSVRNGQSVSFEQVTAAQSTPSPELPQLDKQQPAQQKSATEELLKNSLINLNSAFIEKQSTGFHPEKTNRFTNMQAAPKVKIGQVNVVVETSVVKQKAVKTSVSDNTSRAFLRSL